MQRFHPLHSDIAAPPRFTFPFCYEPHPLCRLAADRLKRHVEADAFLLAEAAKGKMFGVLVVDNGGRLGFLAAFSGLLGGCNDLPFFVPPVYDLLRPDGIFVRGEREIGRLSRLIADIEADSRVAELRRLVGGLHAAADGAVDDYRRRMAAAKAERDARRLQCGAEEEAALVRQSQFMKAELKRLKRRYADIVELAEAQLGAVDGVVGELKRRRRSMSDRLQAWLFDRYVVSNALGGSSTLSEIFRSTPSGTPPSGAGECCAPKLLQHAFRYGMKPLCMAEFWWGRSPAAELRRHFSYYPSCTSKCRPILSFMMQGMEVDPDPLAAHRGSTDVDVVYDDAWLAVVSKPEGMLSVPGTSPRLSLMSLLRERWSGVEPLPVHRLDMSTSGLLVVAKTAAVQEALQRQFEERTVVKRYVALLDASAAAVPPPQGTVSLPLSADPADRPRQRVDREGGRPAETFYRIVKASGGRLRVALYPRTGRTHQLRVHCAHADGLDAPILGDPLYGTAADRMYLHAEYLELTHPVTLERMKFESRPPF